MRATNRFEWWFCSTHVTQVKLNTMERSFEQRFELSSTIALIIYLLSTKTVLEWECSVLLYFQNWKSKDCAPGCEDCTTFRGFFKSKIVPLYIFSELIGRIIPELQPTVGHLNKVATTVKFWQKLNVLFGISSAYPLKSSVTNWAVNGFWSTPSDEYYRLKSPLLHFSEAFLGVFWKNCKIFIKTSVPKSRF